MFNTVTTKPDCRCTVCCSIMHVPEREEPNSVTTASVPEKRRSLTPELRRRSGSFGGGTDSETCRASPASCLPDNTVEQITAPSASPLQTSAVGQLNASSDDALVPAVVSLHNEHDSARVTAPSSHCPDTASGQISATENAETSRSRKKKKKRRSPVCNDNSEDKREVAVKASRKHKRKERLRAANEVDEARKSEDVASKVSSKDNTVASEVSSKDNTDSTPRSGSKDNVVSTPCSGGKDNADSVPHSGGKDNVDSTPRSDHEAKQKKTADGSVRKAIVDDVANSENVNHRKNKTKESDESFASKSFGDECRAKAGTNVIRQYRHQDSIRERTSIKTSTSLKKHRERMSVSAWNESVLWHAIVSTISVLITIFQVS